MLCRGNDFRPQYKQSVKLRSVFNCPCVALSATVTQDIYDDVMGALQLQEAAVTAGLPDRPNIFLNVISKGCLTLETDLLWLLNRVITKQQSCPKSLIFAHSISVVADLYSRMMAFLGRRAFSEGVIDPKKCMVSMYHAHIAEPLRKHTLFEFCKPDSIIRVVVCTIAFGMGVEIADLKQVIQWGKVASVLTFWQEVGRCGRDGSQCTAVLYVKSTAGGRDTEVFNKLKSDVECHRLAVLQAFKLSVMPDDVLDVLKNRQPCSKLTKCDTCVCACCTCCSHCRRLCKCSDV